MTLRTEEQASAVGYLLHAFRALKENPAWTNEFAPRIAEAVKTHADGCRERTKTPLERAEHVEASYLAEELAGFCTKRIGELEADLAAYSRRNENPA